MEIIREIIEDCVRIEPVLNVDVDRIIGLFEKSMRDVDIEHPHRLLSDVCVGLVSVHTDYDYLAARLIVKELHGTLGIDRESFERRVRQSDIYSDEVKEIMLLPEVYDYIDYQKDYSYSIQALKTLMRSYLYDNETPQDMLMRVSIGIHVVHENPEPIEFSEDMRDTYRLMSEKRMTHSTPTLFNAGTRHRNLSSCFLMPVKDDSIEGIFETISDMAVISKHCGGLGVSVSNVRASGSKINRNNSVSSGIVPMLKVMNSVADYVDQGGKRKAACAIYLEPWHADIEQFLELKVNHGDANLRARELFYALWVNDLFMNRVQSNGTWSLFCPSTVPLYEYWGDEFDKRYIEAERKGLYVKQIPAQTLWSRIIKSQIETGGPFMMYKDACNRKSNQRHLGTIRSSNLCTEIVQYSSSEETAVCTIGSVSLTSCVVNHRFNMELLAESVRRMVINLDKVVDNNDYATPESRLSAVRHRAIGVGVQGLADVFFLLKLPFTSSTAKMLNKLIFERIYYEALWQSSLLAEKHGTYSTYDGSPMSRGLLQQDLWESSDDSIINSSEILEYIEGDRPDWKELRSRISQWGVRNSLLTSPMPTASTSQILGNMDCFEPQHANIYNRKSLSGDCLAMNKYLVKDLSEIGLWDDEMRDKIIYHNGSVQDIPEIPKYLREVYKTAWELKARDLIDMAADRGQYIDQSQSFTVFVPHHAKSDITKFLTSVHFHGWRSGCKTGMYYLRSQPGAMPTKVTISATLDSSSEDSDSSICSLDNPDCESCSA